MEQQTWKNINARKKYTKGYIQRVYREELYKERVHLGTKGNYSATVSTRVGCVKGHKRKGTEKYP